LDEKTLAIDDQSLVVFFDDVQAFRVRRLTTPASALAYRAAPRLTIGRFVRAILVSGE
jgi:hypothetical protein